MDHSLKQLAFKGRWGVKGATQEITEMRAGFLFQSRQNLNLLYKLRRSLENMTEKEIEQHHREDRSGSELLIGDVIWEWSKKATSPDREKREKSMCSNSEGERELRAGLPDGLICSGK